VQSGECSTPNILGCFQAVQTFAQLSVWLLSLLTKPYDQGNICEQG
jgi:hypothetical protein